MTQSITNLLQVVQQVLRNIGERPVVNLNVPRTNVIQKTVDTIKDGLREVEMMSDWTWMREQVRATTWVNQAATVPNILRLYGVHYNPPAPALTQLSYPIPQISLEHFQTYTSTPLTNTWNYPQYFAYLNADTYFFNPYPLTPAQQNAIVFTVQRETLMPTLETGTFGMPERYITLLINHVCYMMAVRHLDSTSTAAAFANEVSRLLPTMIQRDQAALPGASNAYRRNRGQYGIW